MRRRRFVKRVEFWRRIAMPEWRVAVYFGFTKEQEEEFKDEDVDACMENDLRIAEARFYVRDKVLRQHPRDIDRVIVHELIHPLLDRVLNHDNDLKPFVGEVAWEVYIAERRDDMEEFVDRMSRLIVDHRHNHRTYYTREVSHDGTG